MRQHEQPQAGDWKWTYSMNSSSMKNRGAAVAARTAWPKEPTVVDARLPLTATSASPGRNISPLIISCVSHSGPCGGGEARPGWSCRTESWGCGTQEVPGELHIQILGLIATLHCSNQNSHRQLPLASAIPTRKMEGPALHQIFLHPQYRMSAVILVLITTASR